MVTSNYDLKGRLAAQANSKSQEHLWFAHKNQVEACYLRS